jgi:Spy/CpxP family protein refolding chaperone
VQRAIRRFVAALVALAALISIAAVARPAFAAPEDKREDKRAKVEQRLKQARHDVLRKEVGLDEAKAKAVEAVLDKYNAERKQLKGEVRGQREALKKLLDQNSNDDGAYTKALKALRESQKKLANIQDREIDELQKMLTPKQQAKFVRALQRFRQQLKRKLEEKRKGAND